MPVTGTQTNAFVGTWDTNWTNNRARTQVILEANGNGTFGGMDGTLRGDFNAEQTVYNGHWSQTSNGASGKCKFELKTPRAFTGSFTREHPAGESGPWDGTKVG